MLYHVTSTPRWDSPAILLTETPTTKEIAEKIIVLAKDTDRKVNYETTRDFALLAV